MLNALDPNYPTTIAKEAVNELPLARFTRTVHLVTTPAAEALAVRELAAERIIGFDTESRPAFRKGDNFPPSLVQLAGSASVFLFQVNRLGGLTGLLPLLEAPALKKVGVALHDDIRRLQRITPFEPSGFEEISDLSRDLGVVPTGLRSLSAIFMGVRISKNAQLSNWARPSLTRKQITYAATDAWISRELYLQLLMRHEQARLLHASAASESRAAADAN